MDVANDRPRANPPTNTSRWPYILLIVLAAGVVYGQCLRFDFVSYDDYELVYKNGDFLSQLSNVLTSFATHAFTSHRPESGYYRPVLLISYIFDFQAWGLNPLGYHLTNIFLHCCTVVIVFFCLEKLLKERLTAFFGSLLFALHPVQTESVAWVAGRNDVLLGLFVSGMLLSYLYYREGAENQRKYLFVAVGSFALALFTKESAAFYILLLPLYDLSVRKDHFEWRKNVFTWSPFISVLATYLIARWSVVGELVGAERLYGATPFIDRILQMPAIVAEHCALVFLPVQLSIVHSVDQLRWLDFPWSIAAVAVMLMLAAAAWYCRRKDGVLFFGLSWFLVGLLPVLGLFPVAVPILEHRLYLPLIGVAILAVRMLGLLSVTETRRRTGMVVYGSVVVILAAMSFLRLPVWTNSITLWTDAIEKSPAVSRSYFNLAGFYFERQQYDSTINLMKKYIALKPDDFIGYSKLRQTYYLAQRYDEAGEVSRQIILKNPANPNRYLEAGMMYEQLQRYDSAAALYNEGLRVGPNVFDLHFHLGTVYQQTNNAKLAELHLRRAVEIAPQDARGLFALGTLYASQNDNERAIDLLERGMIVAPSPDAAKILHQLYVNAGEVQKAQRLAERYKF